MNRLKIKHWLCLLSFTMGIALFQGCGRYPSSSWYYSFIESEQVVEVDADTKSFRIVVRKIENNGDAPVVVFLDTTRTTARHKVHFINDVDIDTLSLRQSIYTIGDFTPMDSLNMYYREVKLLPENIKSEVVIHYSLANVPYDLINQLKVILRPKTNKD